MELHLRCLYHHDVRDRIVSTRQPGGGPAPLVHVGRTRLGNVWRFRGDLPASLVCDLARLLGREAPLASSAGPEPLERLEAIRRVLQAAVGAVRAWRGPAFRFPPLIEVPDGSAELVEIGEDRSGLLSRGFADWIPEVAERQPCLAALEGGFAAALCCSSRPREVASGASCLAAEAGVETRPRDRGRGHAPRVVAAWARAVRAGGGEPMYSTSWDNRPSRAVARKLGLVAYGEDLHFSAP